MNNNSQSIEVSPLHGVKFYLEELREMVLNLDWFDASEAAEKKLHLALNGEFSRTLRQTVNIDVLQQYGAFFTSDTMSDALVNPIWEDDILTVLDPACGAGNLLISYAQYMPLGDSLIETIELWENYLFGFDVALEFVLATKIRLILLAVQRGKFKGRLDREPEDYFPEIKIGDSLKCDWPQVQTILMNPPYTRVPVPEDYKLNESKVTQAALFLHKACGLRKGTRVRAILPDVIRAGRNFKKLRRFVEEHFKLEAPEILGQFDADTGVDVFLFDGVVEPSALRDLPTAIWLPTEAMPTPANTNAVADLFDLCVGAVVPHRHEQLPELPEYKYMDVRHASPWECVDADSLESTRHFDGRTVVPPFVLVRRTSRSGDRHRAVATLVTGNQAVAVENHLIILKPKTVSDVESCKKLVQVLQDSRTNDWLNIGIRCRHLTIGAIGSIPWWNQ